MSKAPLFVYQTDLEHYVKTARIPYDILAAAAKQHLGGFDGATVLDLGVGFQLTHGGLTLALALLDGAKRCFGVDIAHPDLHATDPAKVEFWRHAKETLAVEVQGLEEGRVVFASTDILHFDDFFSKITLLQMSASDMWFKDDMFDVVISNAVFEHVQKPAEVLAELFRVVKPGGGVVANWNPYAGLSMGGHDIGIPFYYPWAHLRLAEKEHIAKLTEVFSDPQLYTTAFPAPHTPTAERAAVYAQDAKLFREQISYDLNKMRIPEFNAFAKKAGFQVLLSNPVVFEDHRRFLTPEIRKELRDYSDDELLQTFHTAVLRKPK